jgi:hypothetical protein
MTVIWVLAPRSLLNFKHKARRYNPDDCRLHIRRRENLKSFCLVQAQILSLRRMIGKKKIVILISSAALRASCASAN